MRFRSKQEGWQIYNIHITQICVWLFQFHPQHSREERGWVQIYIRHFNKNSPLVFDRTAADDENFGLFPLLLLSCLPSLFYKLYQQDVEQSQEQKRHFSESSSLSAQATLFCSLKIFPTTRGGPKIKEWPQWLPTIIL